MPDAGTAGNGPQSTGASPDGQGAAAGTAPSSEAQAQYYAGTYKSREEVERGIAEKEATINRLRSERDKARQTAEQLVSKVALPEPPAPPKLDRKAIAAMIDEKGGEAVVDVLSQIVEETDAAYERKLGEYRKQLDGTIGDMRKQLRDRDPETLQYRDKVNELATKLGIDADQNHDLLLKFAKEVSKGAQPDRPDLPGMSATNVIPFSHGKTSLRDDDVSLLEGSEMIGKLTPAEREALAKIKADTADRRKVR